MRLSPVLPAVALLFVASACGASGSDDAASTTTAADAETTTSGAEEPTETSAPEADGDGDGYAEALALGLSAGDEGAGELVLSAEEAECVAPEWVDIIGVETFTDADVVPEDFEDPDYQFSDLGLDTETGGEMIDAFDGCEVDIVGQLFSTLSEGLDEDQTACLADEFDDELGRQFLIEALVEIDLSAELDAELERIDSTCSLS